MSSIQYFHSETAPLPVKQQFVLQSRLFLASALQPGHLPHKVVNTYSEQRQMKSTLQLAHFHSMSTYLESYNNVDPNSYSVIIKQIHTDTILETAEHYISPSKLLNTIKVQLCETKPFHYFHRIGWRVTFCLKCQ